MKIIMVYILIICLFIWQAIRNGDAWWMGVFAFCAALFMLIIGEKIIDMFENGLEAVVGGLFPTAEQREERRWQKVDNAEIEIFDGEVTDDDVPMLNAVNPLPTSRRIANQKTYHGGGGMFFAQPMWCDQCKHYPLHAYIDGVWVCQCPWHKE